MLIKQGKEDAKSYVLVIKGHCDLLKRVCPGHCLYTCFNVPGHEFGSVIQFSK